MLTMQRMKRAVIHIECVTSSVSDDVRHERLRAEVLAAHAAGRAPDMTVSNKGSKDIRNQGTAIFVEESGRLFLVTARHVVVKQTPRGDELESLILRVPSFDEARRDNATVPGFLMHAGHFACELGTEEEDITVISLADPTLSRFTREVIDDGYEPISIGDLSSEPPIEGDRVWTWGFPGAVAILGEKALWPGMSNWKSSSISLPVAAFGYVSMTHASLPFFWSDMSVFPGFSGAGVVSDRTKLIVGIVSQAATATAIQTGPSPAPKTFIPFGKISHVGSVKAMIARLLEQRAPQA